MSAHPHKITSLDGFPENRECHRWEVDEDNNIIEGTCVYYVIFKDGLWSDGEPLKLSQVILAPEWGMWVERMLINIPDVYLDKEPFFLTPEQEQKHLDMVKRVKDYDDENDRLAAEAEIRDNRIVDRKCQ